MGLAIITQVRCPCEALIGSVVSGRLKPFCSTAKSCTLHLHDMGEAHPTEPELLAFCRGYANDDVAAMVEAHLIDCAECARKVAMTVRQLRSKPS